MPRGVPNRQAANGGGTTKTDAVRQALAGLGPDAKPTEIRQWIQQTLRMDVGPNSISALKTMLNKQGPAKSKSTGQDSGMSKLEGVRRAVAKLGRDAKPQDIQPYLKEHFAIDMPTTLISNYKSHLARKAARKRARKRKLAASAAVASAANGNGFTIQEIEAVKQVVAEIGAEKVQQLAAVLK
jgi:hypothetical protein